MNFSILEYKIIFTPVCSTVQWRPPFSLPTNLYRLRIALLFATRQKFRRSPCQLHIFANSLLSKIAQKSRKTVHKQIFFLSSRFFLKRKCQGVKLSKNSIPKNIWLRVRQRKSKRAHYPSKLVRRKFHEVRILCLLVGGGGVGRYFFKVLLFFHRLSSRSGSPLHASHLKSY